MAVSSLIGAGGATIYAQATTPIYAVGEINVPIMLLVLL
jgi:hypothetical protein